MQVSGLSVMSGTSVSFVAVFYIVQLPVVDTQRLASLHAANGNKLQKLMVQNLWSLPCRQSYDSHMLSTIINYYPYEMLLSLPAVISMCKQFYAFQLSVPNKTIRCFTHTASLSLLFMRPNNFICRLMSRARKKLA